MELKWEMSGKENGQKKVDKQRVESGGDGVGEEKKGQGRERGSERWRGLRRGSLQNISAWSICLPIVAAIAGRKFA